MLDVEILRFWCFCKKKKLPSGARGTLPSPLQNQAQYVKTAKMVSKGVKTSLNFFVQFQMSLYMFWAFKETFNDRRGKKRKEKIVKMCWRLTPSIASPGTLPTLWPNRYNT